MKRILIATRGEMARRLIRQFHDAGLETVAIFSEPDVEQPWVEEADYPLYLNGRTVAETYLDLNKVVSAAMDAGCDVLHPGCDLLADRLDFLEYAFASNIAVVAPDREILARVSDRAALREAAEALSIALAPASDPVETAEDAAVAAARLGFPLVVRAVTGELSERVGAPDALAGAFSRVQDAARALSGHASVFLERAVDPMRRVSTVVVADRRGRCVHLGHVDSSLQGGHRTWVEEAGEAVLPGDAGRRLGDKAVALAEKLGWVGVGRVRWGVTPEGGAYLLGFTARLSHGYSLVEQVHGLDLVQAQFDVISGEPLGWKQGDDVPRQHGVQVQIHALGDGVLERFEVPDDVLSELGTAEGQIVGPDSDPLLCKLTALAPTRHAALVRARAAVEALVIEGVPTNRGALLGLLADPDVWKGGFDTTTAARYPAT